MLSARAKVCLLASCVVLFGGDLSSAWACGACRGPAGAGSALTAPWETWGVALLFLHQPVHGQWHEGREYTTAEDESSTESRDRRFSELTLGLGWRPMPRVELAFSLPYVQENFYSDQQKGLGDTVARVRWEVLAEPAFLSGHAGEFSPWPSLGLSFSARMPTGDSRQMTKWNVAPGQGTWELALAADTRVTFLDVWQIALIGEGAYRLPYEKKRERIERGPRLLGRASLLYLPSTPEVAYTLGLMADTWWEGEGLEGGEPTSSNDRLGVGLLGGFKLLRSGFRSSLALMANPPWNGMGRNMIGFYTMSVSVGYAQ